MSNILDFNLLQISSLIKEKKVSPIELTNKLIHEIESSNKMNNAFITVCKETALAEAKNAEKEIMNGNYKGPLHGVPLSIKDNISVKSTRRTNGSIIIKDYISQTDAPVVKQLRSKGAIIIGKTNLDEFANHVMGKNEHYGTIRNPFNYEYSAGGSSGGSAVSVASNLSYGSIGTDTSGSVRIPASCCGIVGLKPTYNLIPTFDVTPLSWSLDHVGILTKDCTDLSIMFNSIVPGHKQRSSHVDKKLNEMTVGIPENYFFESLESSVKSRIREVISVLQQHGAGIKHVKIQNMKEILDVQEIIIGAEAIYFYKFNLVEYRDKYEKGNYDFFLNGLTISQSQYNKALAIREEISQEFQNTFLEIDVLLTPTLPITPPKLTTEKVTWGGQEEDILNTLSRFTGPFNVSGLPALSVPVGFNTDGLPIGLQIVGKMYSENQLISVGNMIIESVNP